jgi:hypothetical protein
MGQSLHRSVNGFPKYLKADMYVERPAVQASAPSEVKNVLVSMVRRVTSDKMGYRKYGELNRLRHGFYCFQEPSRDLRSFFELAESSMKVAQTSY